MKMWQIANRFRQWVCSELRDLNPKELLLLSFVVMVDQIGAWSLSLSENSYLEYEVDSDCLFPVNSDQVHDIINGSSRSKILTDSITLEKLLSGSLKAHVAFITGRVTISGDLLAFLKMVSHLKKKKLDVLLS
jgi:hypothetical protein